MDIPKAWERALRETEIIRSRIQALHTFSDTQVPYIFLSESSVNTGDTVVRRGRVLIRKPSIILPPNVPQFEGFEFEKESSQENVINFLLLRGITLPSLKYDNKIYSLDIHEGKLSDAVNFFNNRLQRQEDVHTGLVLGPEDLWPLSVLIFICGQVVKNADSDIRKLLDEYKKHNP